MWFFEIGIVFHGTYCEINCVASKNNIFKILPLAMAHRLIVVWFVVWWRVIGYESLHAKCFSIFSSSCELTWSLHENCSQYLLHLLISLQSASFPIVYPSVGETIDLPWWSKVEHRELILKFSSRVPLSTRYESRVKRI